MLSRTAAHLYWMARYMERAENLTRILKVTQTFSLMPSSRSGRHEIGAPLAITGSLEDFTSRYGEPTMASVLRYFVTDDHNPGSIVNCIRAARENGHAVRGTITSEVWESLNATYLEMRDWLKKGVDESEIETFFDYIMERSQLFLGAVSSTVLRNDVHRFITVGTAIERADNTARMLDVKYQVMKAQRKDSDRATDFYHWSALLRALSAFEAYHVVYGDQITAEQVAELLILRSDLPRSLRACVSLLAATLPLIEGEAGLEAKRLAAELHAQLRYGDIEYCFAKGLHDYLGEFLQRISGIAVAIHHAYLEAA